MQQRAAKRGKEQHKAKVTNRLILPVATHGPAKSSKPPQRTARLVEEAIIDAYGESEQRVGLLCMLQMNLACPFVTKVLGTAVSVERIDLNDADEIVAVCRRGRQRQLIPILDLRLLSPRPAGWEWIEAYRHWAAAAASRDAHAASKSKQRRRFGWRMLGASPHRSASAEHRSSVPYDPPLDRPAQFQYIVRMASKTIETRAHTTKDGRLNLSVDVDVADADVAVVVTVTPVPVGGHVDENGWPEGFFDRVAGSMPGLRRGSQGDFEERLPLE